MLAPQGGPAAHLQPQWAEPPTSILICRAAHRPSWQLEGHTCPERQGPAGQPALQFSSPCPTCILSSPLLSSQHLVLNTPNTLTSTPGQQSAMHSSHPDNVPQMSAFLLPRALLPEPPEHGSRQSWRPFPLLLVSKPHAPSPSPRSGGEAGATSLPLCSRTGENGHLRALETRGLKERKPQRKKSWLWVSCHQWPFLPQGTS